ncbi:MAG: HU family DNA-binding protein, partial [Peptostreptococcaceae bacterium]|nr:HU family DNA-binding protein [Peptostreptococcaceae bacterium]
MKYIDFVKEISAQSKETERPLAQDDVKVCFDLAREVIIYLLNKGDHLVIRDFLKFETKTQKGRVINAVNSNKKVEIPD